MLPNHILLMAKLALTIAILSVIVWKRDVSTVRAAFAPVAAGGTARAA